MNEQSYDLNTLLDILYSAVNEFYERDTDLLTNNKAIRKGMERSCAFRIGYYLCNLIKGTMFDNYDVDMEYNKNSMQQKNLEKRNVCPDLIIHKRWSNDNNLLVIEFKHGVSSDSSNDIRKLKGFTRNNGSYKYKLGVLLELGSCALEVKYTFFRNGKEVTIEELEVNLNE